METKPKNEQPQVPAAGNFDVAEDIAEKVLTRKKPGPKAGGKKKVKDISALSREQKLLMASKELVAVEQKRKALLLTIQQLSK